MRRRIASGSELERLRRHIDNLFALLLHRADDNGEGWVPTVDLLELPDRYVVRLDVPDVSLDRLAVRVVNRELHVCGTKGDRRTSLGRHFHRVERGVGHFAVEVLLPSPVDPTSATASLDRGVLEVSLPLLYGRRDAVHTIPVVEEER